MLAQMNFVNEVTIMIKKKRKNGLNFIRQNKETHNEYVGLRRKHQDEGKKQTNLKTLID